MLSTSKAASLYHYFADRHQVAAELVQRHLTEVDARLTAALNNPKLHSARRHRRVIDPYLAYFREHPDFIRCGSETVTGATYALRMQPGERVILDLGADSPLSLWAPLMKRWWCRRGLAPSARAAVVVAGFADQVKVTIHVSGAN